MPKGVSLHIGLDFVDKQHYGMEARLPSCVNDAEAMEKLAVAAGFKTCTLLNEEATSHNIRYFLDLSSASLHPGDICMITFSGHGSYFQDLNGDEENGLDECWLLFDRKLIDDELYVAWNRFAPGVRILVISDSCHSGTITKSDQLVQQSKRQKLKKLFQDSRPTYERNSNRYDKVLKDIDPKTANNLECAVILLAASQDDQFAFASSGNTKNSLFTETLLSTWKRGSFYGTYRDLHSSIRKKMPSYQEPNYSFIGDHNIFFENQKPFTI